MEVPDVDVIGSLLLLLVGCSYAGDKLDLFILFVGGTGS